jgi:RNA polymerase sigma-70 factor, ECF subfamily
MPEQLPPDGSAARAFEQTEEVFLLGRIAAGDREAFAQLFDQEAPTVLGLLTRLLRDRGRAEEVLQETFLQVWQQAGRYRQELARPRSWILMMARSRALDGIRARQSRERREETVEQWQGARVEEPVGTAGLEEDEHRRRVAAALAGLPAEQRQCIELAFFDGLTHSEIAQRLAAPLGTVKSRILLGMNKLRHTLDAYST